MTVSLDMEIRDIYQLYYKDVYHMLLCFTNRNDAEDLTQEVFIRVLKALPNFAGRSQLKTWIMSIARNTAIDHYRKRKVLDFLEENILSNLASRDKSLDDQVTEEEESRELYLAMKKLKANYRMAIYLRGIKEYSIKESAEILGISESKVKVDYHRGLKKLSQLLEVPFEGGFLLDES